MKRRLSKTLIAMLALAVTLLASCSSGPSEQAPVVEKSRYPLTFVIDYEANLLFAKYDLGIAVDGEEVTTIAQGDLIEETIEVEEGKHEVAFHKVGDSDALSSVDLNITEPSCYECSIKAHSSSLDITNVRFETAAARKKRIADEVAAAEKEEAERKAKEEEEAAALKAQEEKEAAEQKARQEREEREAKERQEAEKKVKAGLEECVGKKAAEAKKYADGNGLDVSFQDSKGNDVTDLYDAMGNGSAISKSKVSEVQIDDGSPLEEVTFKLKYKSVNPESLEGEDLVKACQTLEKAGVSYKIYGDYTGDDLTSLYEQGTYGGGDMTITKAEWGDAAKTSMDLKVLAQAQIDENKARVEMEENLEGKLELSVAWAAAEQYGKALYGSDFKLHYILGVLAEEPADENTWFLKATCDVYGVDGFNCEAYVSGTTNDPVIVGFNVY